MGQITDTDKAISARTGHLRYSVHMISPEAPTKLVATNMAEEDAISMSEELTKYYPDKSVEFVVIPATDYELHNNLFRCDSKIYIAAIKNKQAIEDELKTVKSSPKKDMPLDKLIDILQVSKDILMGVRFHTFNNAITFVNNYVRREQLVSVTDQGDISPVVVLFWAAKSKEEEYKHLIAKTGTLIC